VKFQMIERIVNFLEKHAEKLVWAAVGLLGVWLLFTRVVISPNCVVYDNKKFEPGEIDKYVYKQSEVLRERLGRKPVADKKYESQFEDFYAKFISPVDGIGANLKWPLPYYSTVDPRTRGIYHLPEVGEVNNVKVEHIRAVAYMPTTPVDEENPYERVEHEPNDLDLVTVEAKFNVSDLYKKFYESFAGYNVKKEWRDPCLARPVFGAVDLERQEQLPDGSWSDWKIVPRIGIDYRKKLFAIIEDIENLPPGGMKVRLLRLNNWEVQKDLLQPDAYQIASAEEEWFPPTLHEGFIAQQRDKQMEEKRKAKEMEKKQRESEKQRTRSARGGGSRFGLGMMEGDFGEFGGGGSRTSARTALRRQQEKERELKKKAAKPEVDYYEELKKLQITKDTDFSKMKEPLTFWAHDDTVEPGKTYRYRIRLGVLNPIAGTGQVSKEENSFDNKAILWSDFSKVTEPVEIPARLYAFPIEAQKSPPTVTVQVSRYKLGYWYSKKFTVGLGEVIGKAVEYEPPADQKEDITVPETIDYGTGTLLVDLVTIHDYDWVASNELGAREYSEMLYTHDGTDIEHLAVKPRFWPSNLVAKFYDIKRAEKEEKQPLRSWGGRAGRRRMMGPAGPGGFFDEEQQLEEEYYQQIYGE